MNIAVIGLGYWGRNHLRVFKELQKEGIIDRLYVHDINREAIENIKKKDIIVGTIAVDNLINVLKVDAVSIVTPSNTHYKIAKAFLEAGKDVFVEKPMTLNSDQAKELIEIAEKNDCILMPGHIFRFHPAIIELKKRIDNGDFGKIYNIYTERLSLAPARNDMGVLFALAIHEVDLYCYFTNKKYPEDIFATRSKFLQQEVEESAFLSLTFEGNIKTYAFESWVNPFHNKKRIMYMWGSKGGAKIDYLKPNELHLCNRYIKDGKTHDEGMYTVNLGYKEPLKEELKHFVECVKNRKTPIADMHSGYRAVKMIEIAMKSANEKRVIKIEEELKK